MSFVQPAYAVCPVCTVAVGSGLAIAELLGVDSLIASLWIGALIISTGIWMGDKFRLIKLPKPRFSWSIIMYLLTIGTLYIQKKIFQPTCIRILGMDKIFFGISTGAVIFLLGFGADQLLRKLKAGKALFPFQKVVIPLLFIAIASFVFYKTLCL